MSCPAQTIALLEGWVKTNILKVHAWTTPSFSIHISKEFLCRGELRQLCSQQPTGEGEQASPFWHQDPPNKGGTDSTSTQH